MHRLTFGIALVLLLVSRLASAQVPAEVKNSTPEVRAKAWTLEMKEKLALTPEQLPKVEAINLESAQQMEPVLKGTDGPLIKLRKTKQLEASRDAALKPVLTPVQFQQWQVARAEMKQKVEQKLMEKKP